MKVAITGGTGFVGPAVVQAMLDEGHDVVVLEHHKPVPIPDHARLRRVKGDIMEPASLRAAFAGCDAVAHLVAIIKPKPEKGITFERIHVEGTRNVVDAAKAEGVRRFLLMSANGVDLGVETPYFRTKREMERLVKEAGFDWTIFRPSYVADSTEGGFDAQFADIVDTMPVLPAFGGGRFKIQPVARKDVAEAFAHALSKPASVGHTYTLVGPERMEWRDYLERLADIRDRKRVIAPVPWGAALALARLPGFPAEPDQLRMMRAGNVGDATEAVRDLDLDLTRWEDAVSGLRR